MVSPVASNPNGPRFNYCYLCNKILEYQSSQKLSKKKSVLLAFPGFIYPSRAEMLKTCLIVKWVPYFRYRAKAICISFGASIMEINSMVESDFMKDLTKRHGGKLPRQLRVQVRAGGGEKCQGVYSSSDDRCTMHTAFKGSKNGGYGLLIHLCN